MSKILLALSILSVSTGGFLAARKSTSHFQREASAAREIWIQQTQLVAAAHGQQAELTEHFRELSQALGHARPVEENSLWSALQTDQKGKLTPAQLERLLQELGFNWQSSPDFIVITKQALRDAGGWTLLNGQCSELDATVLAMTPEERSQVEVSIQRARTEINDWVMARAERSGATVEYISPDLEAWRSAAGNFEEATTRALRRNRAQLLGNDWLFRRLKDGGLTDGLGLDEQTSMVIAREMAGNQQRLKVETSRFVTLDLIGLPGPGETHEIRVSPEGIRKRYHRIQSGNLPEFKFPDAFRCTFPNGWADVAEREGFELPKEAQKK